MRYINLNLPFLSLRAFLDISESEKHVLSSMGWCLFNLWPMPLVPRRLESGVTSSVRMLPATSLKNALGSISYLIAISQIQSKEEQEETAMEVRKRASKGKWRDGNIGLATEVDSQHAKSSPFLVYGNVAKLHCTSTS